MKLIYSMLFKLYYKFSSWNRGGAEMNVCDFSEHIKKDLGIDDF